MIWFSGDSHFSHDNIRKHSSRPFDSVQEMDKALLDNINAVTQPGDSLYHLGDFAWPRGKNWRDQLDTYRDTINCKNVHWITGNHDQKRWVKYLAHKFTTVSPLKEIKVHDLKVVLCHYAMLTWNKRHFNRPNNIVSVQLFGHSHGKLTNHSPYQMDVGVDNAFKLLGEYRPWSMLEVLAQIQTQILERETMDV